MTSKSSGTSSLKDPINSNTRARIAAKSGDPSIDGLHVIAEVDNFNPQSSGGVPAISPNMKTYYTDTNQALTSSFATVFSNSGNGLLFSFGIEFTSDQVELRLVIDGNNVFTYTYEEIENFAFFGDDASGERDVFFHRATSDRLLFKPPWPIKYNSSFDIQARETSGNRSVDWINVYYTDEP